VKNKQLTKVLFGALVAASSSVMAASDYPAADFQPKVLYSDASAASSGQEKTEAKASSAVSDQADANFPATNYQPKVLYSDADYKHNSAAPGSASSAKAVVADSESGASSAPIEGQPASNDSSLIGLLVLAAGAGFYFFNKKSNGQGVSANRESTQAYNTGNSEGVTGVEKYLEKLGGNKTGVAKYLEKQGASPSTGVAKYVAKQIVRDRAAAADRATGVEKYLRDKG